MHVGIINRGRGPEIAGTRITVYDIMDYLEEGWLPITIASWFRISSSQVQAAIDYIEQNKAEVSQAYKDILARSAARKNSPEIEAKRAQSHARLQAKLERLRRQKLSG